MVSRSRLGLLVLLGALARPAAAATPSPVATAATPFPSPSPAALAASATAAATATRFVTPSPVRPIPSPTGAVTVTSGQPFTPSAAAAPADPLLVAPAATAVRVQPRVFRTPERAGPPVFVAPQAGDAPATGDALGGGGGAPAPAMGARPPARANGGLVVFRVSARTALEGFDLRVGYPRAAGAFGTAARPAECNAGTGVLVAANDRGDGELRLLVASAQALPIPLDVFCRFTTEPGAGIATGDFTVRVAEVTRDGTRADPGLLLVSVVVR